MQATFENPLHNFSFEVARSPIMHRAYSGKFWLQ
jgi:hypothetical protein